MHESLGFSAAEVAEALATSPAAMDSALQRARATLASAAPAWESVGDPTGHAAREVVGRYVRAFERTDVDGLVALLTEDVVLEMPPVPLWYRDRTAHGAFMTRVSALRGARWRIVTTTANANPPSPPPRRAAPHRAEALTLGTAGITRNVVVADPRVLTSFALPTTLPS